MAPSENFTPKPLKLSPEVVAARKAADEERNNRTLDQVTEDIRRERVRRQHKAVMNEIFPKSSDLTRSKLARKVRFIAVLAILCAAILAAKNLLSVDESILNVLNGTSFVLLGVICGQALSVSRLILKNDLTQKENESTQNHG